MVVEAATGRNAYHRVIWILLSRKTPFGTVLGANPYDQEGLALDIHKQEA
jgi:hypothetical protein